MNTVVYKPVSFIIPKDVIENNRADPALGIMESYMESWRNDIHQTALKCLGKKADDLTEKERFAIAVMGGARITCVTGTDGLNAKFTTEECGICENGKGGFNVMLIRGPYPCR